MIRDPSDGSVREKIVSDALEVAAALGRQIVNEGAARAGLPPISGLPDTSTKPENLARLEKSREWLKSYKQGLVQDRAEAAETSVRSPEQGEG